MLASDSGSDFKSCGEALTAIFTIAEVSLLGLHDHLKLRFDICCTNDRSRLSEVHDCDQDLADQKVVDGSRATLSWLRHLPALEQMIAGVRSPCFDLDLSCLSIVTVQTEP